MTLLQRLEEAEGPDPYLDQEIAILTGADPHASILDGPAYTSSIDAALTLVPAEWRVPIVRLRIGDCVKLTQETKAVVFNHVGGPEAEGDATHKSPAIALCIAALRARSYQEREG